MVQFFSSEKGMSLMISIVLFQKSSRAIFIILIIYLLYRELLTNYRNIYVYISTDSSNVCLCFYAFLFLYYLLMNITSLIFITFFPLYLGQYLSYSFILFFVKDSVLIFLPVFLTILINSYLIYKQVKSFLPHEIQRYTTC